MEAPVDALTSFLALLVGGGFVTRAALAGVALALATGPLGCFVVWRRMAYFGDATAHAAVLGVALALVLQISTLIGVLAVALTVAVLVGRLADRMVAADTLLGVAAHGSLAVGLVAVSIAAPSGLAIESLLFGDILAVGWGEVATIWAGAGAVVAVIAWRWSALVTATLGPDLARASGIDPDRERTVLTVALALVVAMALQVVGVLLVTAMLIIPATVARPLARSPEAMAAIAALAGVLAVLGGLGAAFVADTPAGPTMVSAALALCLAAWAGAATQAALARLATTRRAG